MKLLIIYAHPIDGSATSRLCDMAMSICVECGHDVKLVDLYKDGFNPVLSASEKLAHDHGEQVGEDLQRYVDDVKWANGLLLIYPTWWHGAPAILKGYLDRVWTSGVAFALSPNGRLATGTLKNIRIFGVITTHGAPSWHVRYVMGSPNKKAIFHGIKRLLSGTSTSLWIAKYNMDRVKPDQFEAIERSVARKLRKLLWCSRAPYFDRREDRCLP